MGGLKKTVDVLSSLDSLFSNWGGKKQKTSDE
jgi:hypothetical protein